MDHYLNNTNHLPHPYLMNNTIQHYSWGTTGANAFIPNFLGTNACSQKPFAELWIGAHSKAPSEIIDNDDIQKLDKYIRAYPEYSLGKRVSSIFNNTLPFMLKILSVKEALSIQVHPDNIQAIQLHNSDPDHYPDANGKPEIAIAISPVKALAGFKNKKKIINTFNKIPELGNFIFQNELSENNIEQHTLKNICTLMVKQSKTHFNELQDTINNIEKSLKADHSQLNDNEKIFLQLRKKYTWADIGLLFVLLLNLIELKPSEGIFLKPGTMHAYLSGDLFECMTNSDNVVRAGLTSKFTDPETLVKILNFHNESLIVYKSNPDSKLTEYKTPTEEFIVTRHLLDKSSNLTINSVNSPQILLITEGSIVLEWNNGPNKIFHSGQSVFVPAALDKISIKTENKSSIFQAYVP